jgi:hypothetical protein
MIPLIDSPVHARDLAIGPRVLWLGEPVINALSGASISKAWR